MISGSGRVDDQRRIRKDVAAREVMREQNRIVRASTHVIRDSRSSFLGDGFLLAAHRRYKRAWLTTGMSQRLLIL